VSRTLLTIPCNHLLYVVVFIGVVSIVVVVTVAMFSFFFFFFFVVVHVVVVAALVFGMYYSHVKQLLPNKFPCFLFLNIFF